MIPHDATPDDRNADPSNTRRLPGNGRARLLLALLSLAVLGGLIVIGLATRSGPDEHDVVTMAPYINVKDYGATGDGLTDDTAAIQRAISRNVGQLAMQTIYFPAGTYLVSNRLEWRDEHGDFQPYLTLQGESRDTTVIRLKDGAAGFDNPGNPKAVIFTASGLFVEQATGGGKNYRKLGEGNEAFQNFIYDLTVDTGAGNPGAIGIDFLGNNLAAIRNVLVRSGDGSGVAGISMTRQWVGPALLKHVEVVGFDYGIDAAQSEYGITFEDIEVSGQNRAGVRNHDNVLSFRDLSSDNSVPALLNTGGAGLVVLIDSDFAGGSTDTSAVINEVGEVYLRNVSGDGYRSLLQDGSTVVPGLELGEYASLGSVPAGGGSLGIVVKETPEPPVEPVDSWVSVADFGARAFDSDGQIDYDDDAEAVQEAIDSGATTIYFPPGRYLFSDTVTVRNNVQRIEFRGSAIGVTSKNAFGDGRPLLAIGNGAPPVVVLNQLGDFDASNMPADKEPYIRQATGRALVIRDSALPGFRTGANAGPLFLEDVCCGRLEIDDQQVWARQLNIEVDGEPMITNNSGDLWVLGLKTERAATVARTMNAGRTEVLGGLLYPSTSVPADQPAFVNNNASQTLVYATSAYDGGSTYGTQSLTLMKDNVRRLLDADLPRRKTLGSFVFLLRD
jgi:hypothetical protein